MKINEIIKKFGGQTNLANLLGIRQSAIAYWVKKGSIPNKWHEKIIEIAQQQGLPLTLLNVDVRESSTAEYIDSYGNGFNLSNFGEGDLSNIALAPSQFIFYTSTQGQVKVKVFLDDETIWTTQQGMAEIFDTTKQTISYHLNNIFKELELVKTATVKEILTVQTEGNRSIERQLEYYNLDVIISIGYRVKSQKGVRFRQWATSVLKNYIQNGYVINGEKITNDRFVSLENDVNILKSQMNKINSKIKENSLEFNQNIFFDGQIYDSYSFVNDLIKLAKSEIVLIDNYIDDTVFTLFSKYPNINFTIYTSTISKQLKLDFEKYSKQYKNISLKTFKSSHDRFLIIDKKEIYHLGASLKDLGKKWFLKESA